MEKGPVTNAKLGLFIIAGLLFLVVLLYLIGKNRNLFGSTFELKARFDNVQGLVVGNNVRFAGIQAGTIKNIDILSDTIIEVSMVIDKKMLGIIKKDAIASIGTDGLVGNRIINLVPSGAATPLAEENDILLSKRAVSTDDMMRTLYKTNTDVAVIAADIKTTVQKLNNSNALWTLLNDPSIPNNLRTSVKNIQLATYKAGTMASNLNEIVLNVKNGKGSVGAILNDTSFANRLNEAIVKIKTVGDDADALVGELNKAVAGIQQDVNNGKGTIHALLKDSTMVIKINNSLDNIQKGTDGFNQNMEALKHNFLLRGYFNRMEREKVKADGRKL